MEGLFLARLSHSPTIRRRLRDHVGAAQAVAFQDATGPRRSAPEENRWIPSGSSLGGYNWALDRL